MIINSQEGLYFSPCMIG